MAGLAAAVCVAVVVLVALSLASSGVGSAPTAVQLLVTRDFGSHVLHRAGPSKAQSHETVMALLRDNGAVEAVSGGRGVQGIDGLSSGSEGRQPLDWFYYVNGVEAPRGAAVTAVYPGDHVWWDLHNWSQAQKVPAVVGSFPEPFLNGFEGKRLPVRIECAAASTSACSTVIERLRALDVPAAVAAIGSGGAPETLRVMVAPWGGLEASLAQGLERGPRDSGVYARFSANGGELALLDRDGQTVQTLAAGSGLIAATRQAKEAPVWLITGTDAAGVDRAAQSLDRATLQNRFAVAIAANGAIALPETDR